MYRFWTPAASGHKPFPDTFTYAEASETLNVRFFPFRERTPFCVGGGVGFTFLSRAGFGMRIDKSWGAKTSRAVPQKVHVVRHSFAVSHFMSHYAILKKMYTLWNIRYL